MRHSVDLTAFPNSSGVKVTQSPRWLKVTYRGGCPESDPSFAQKLDINGSAACRRQTCLSTSWLAALRDNFKTRIKHLRLRDLFFPLEACCNIPYVERSLYAAFYPTARIGSDCTLYDFLMNERALTAEQGTVAGDCCRQGG